MRHGKTSDSELAPPAAIDLDERRRVKNIHETTDENCRDAVDDFLKRWKDDTLTGR
jgi:hypothetical protein